MKHSAFIFLVALCFVALTSGVIVFGFVFSDISGLRGINSVFTRAYDDIFLEQAWEKIVKHKNALSIERVVVGVIDTGIDSDHPEFDSVDLGSFPRSALQDQIFERDCGDGKKIRVEGHGTAVAGIIGANNVSDNENGGYIPPQMNGVLSGALDESEYGLEIGFTGLNFLSEKTKFDVRYFTERAIRKGAKIVNMSFGARSRQASPQDPCAVPEKDFRNMTENWTRFFRDIQGQEEFSDRLFVIGAGNASIPLAFVTPANVVLEDPTIENVIIVGAVAFNGQRADFSNFGLGIDISAPGVGVYVPQPGNQYDTNFGGTSAAAPMVTGVAGLLKAIDSFLTPAELKNILTSTADPIATGEIGKPIGSGCFDAQNNPDNFTGCRLNALNAVVRVLPVDIKSVIPDTLDRGATVTVSINGDNFSSNVTTFDFGPDIIVSSVTVFSPELLQAEITIGAVAALGPRDVTVIKADPAGSTDFLADAVTIQGIAPPPPQTSLPWPQFQHDERHTGQSPFQGPQTNNIKWTAGSSINTTFLSTPVVGNNDAIYIGARVNRTGTRHLLSFDPNGTLRWQSPPLVAVPSTPAIVTDGIVLIVSGTGDFGANIIAFDDADGSIAWTSPAGDRVDFMTLAPDGTLYFTNEDGELVSLTPTQTGATENWRILLGSRVIVDAAPAVGSDGTIFVVDKGGTFNSARLFALNPVNGSTKWIRSFVGNSSSIPLILDDETIIVATPFGLLGFNPDNGSDAFSPIPYAPNTAFFQFPDMRFPPAPILLPDGRIGVLTKHSPTQEGFLQRINIQTEEVAFTSIGTFDGFIRNPITDSDGTIYLGFALSRTQSAGGAFIKAFTTQNTLLFDVFFDGLSGDIALGSNNALYVPTIELVDQVGQAELKAIGL